MTTARTPHGRRWETVNPDDYTDGILYLPAMVELQPRQPYWGHPDQPGLRDQVANDRPHGIGGEKLLCLLCMRLRAQRNQPRIPVWLTFVEGQYGPMFRHEDGRSPHAEHQPETDIHKAIKEREARTWLASGATNVDIEVWRPRARRRPDVFAEGPELKVAGEIQHSPERPRVIQQRQRSLRQAGDRVVWTTDRDAKDIAFLHAVPHLAIPSMNDHRYYLTERVLEIGGGAITFEAQRCGWADIWTGTQRCPVTRKATPCGRMHLYPSFETRDYRWRPAAGNSLFPCGERLHLDHLLEGILHGGWLPYRIPRNNRVTWVPADVHDQVSEERGANPDQGELAAVRRRDEAAERACERRIPQQRIPEQAAVELPVPPAPATPPLEVAITTTPATRPELWAPPQPAPVEKPTPPPPAVAPANPVEPQPAAERVNTPCCGVKYPFWVGRTPLPHGCQLCPDSPTYWRRT